MTAWVSEQDVTDTQFCTDALEAGKRYTWQVIAVNAQGRTASDEWKFRVSPNAGE